MGSHRQISSAASVPQPRTVMQTHTPSGSSPSPAPDTVDRVLVKQEPSSDLEVGLNVTQSENWVESYQDLSSWCSATSACSPETYQSPVTDELPTSVIEFQGEIDFDLRKSEEIASVPLEEDSNFNLWGTGNHSSETTITAQPVTSTGKSNPVLLNDCWLFKIEGEEGVKRELETSRSQSQSTRSTSATTSQYQPLAPLLVKPMREEATAAKENMNPVHFQQSRLLSPAKMAELQQRLERIASHTHPGANSKAKAADLMKILQEQMAIFNKKKYNSPAAVADLHNHQVHTVNQHVDIACSSASISQHRGPAATHTTLASSEDIFRSDPFEDLFSIPDSFPVQPIGELQMVNPCVNSQPVPAPNFVVSNTVTVNAPVSQGGSSSRVLGVTNLFNEAHQEVMRSALKPQHQLQQQLYQSVEDQQQLAPQPQPQPFLPFSPYPSASASAAVTVKKEPEVAMQASTPRGLASEFDLNLDTWLFGTYRDQGISTPEVLKPLVDSPDPESFDLLSYLCDDKVSTPPVPMQNSLQNNPFQFPQPSTSQKTIITTTLAFNTNHQPNVMVVKPMPAESSEEYELKGQKPEAVIVEVKPQLMPSALIEEERIPTVELVEELKVEQSTSRPTRSPRKRKYSDDYVFAPSPTEEFTKSSRRKRTPSSKYDSDEDYTLPERKPRKKPRAQPVIEEENIDEEGVITKKRQRLSSGGSARSGRGERTVSTSSETDRYRELRDRNNEASRKSRLTRKAREQELGKQVESLTKENRVLKVKVEEMENLVKKLREALLQSMMKKA